MSKEEEKTKVFLGRPSNSVGMGIVGMPNVGKSTLFNTLSKLNVPSENFPFCTIDPNVAVLTVPDPRMDELFRLRQPKAIVPAVLKITDIAGLVKGAHEGKGLGNAFLSHISAVDAIYHVCRAFKDKEIEHVEGSVDPIRDLEIISDELIQKDLQRVSEKLDGMVKALARNMDKTNVNQRKQEVATLTKAKELLEAKKDIRNGNWNHLDAEVLIELQLLSAKPVVYLVNIAKDEYITQKNKWIVKVREWVTKRDGASAKVIPFSAAFESEVVKLGLESEEAKKKFLADAKVPSMLDKIVVTGYHALDLIHYFTVGPMEVRAWTVRKGATAPRAAGVIHTDFEKHFIMAEQMTYEDYKHYGSEAEVKAAGKYKQQGKNYVVQDGDILLFKHNAK